MLEARRRAYLEAMGYDIWAAKPDGSGPGRLLLQPGDGDVLLVCDSPDASGGLLAGDISRALGGDVVWAWPDQECRPESLTLEEAVGRQLLTRVLIFGSTIANRLFGNEIPLVVGSARIVTTLNLEDLAENGGARRSLWHQVCGKQTGPA